MIIKYLRMDSLDSDDNDVREYVNQLETIVESSPNALFVKDTDGQYEFANAAATELLDREKADIVGATDKAVFGEESAFEIRRHEQYVLETETTQTFRETLPTANGQGVFETTRAPYYDAEGSLAGTACIFRNVTERRVRERALENQRDELVTLDRINEVAQQIIRTLIGEPSREEIEQAVCERLADSELYQFAWIGEPDPSRTGLSGLVQSNLDDRARALVETLDVSEDTDGPVPSAYYTGETQVVTNVREEESLSKARREKLLESGVRSGIAVPIRYGDTTYGVLTVGSDRPSGFSAREADAFDVLGDVIGFAIGAVKHRRLALSDTVFEVELRLTNSDSFYVAVSERLDCTIRLEGMAPGPSGNLLFYNTVRGAEINELQSFATEWDAVEGIRLVNDRGDGSLVEFNMSGASLVLTLSEYGAKTRDAISENGEVRIVAELPSDANVRNVVEYVQTKFPGVELVAKRKTERNLQPPREFRQDLTDRLTDAQRTALRASYFAGYYEWPRDSTAEEIADSLDISSPTFHQHIRKAQQQLLDAFFDANEEQP